MKFHPLIPRFPGSKRRYMRKPGILPSQPVDLYLAPFAGSGSDTLFMIQNGWAKRAIVGDVDPMLRCIWESWLKGDWAKVYNLIEDWKGKFAAMDSDEAWARLKHESRTGSTEMRAAASLCLRKLTFGGVTREGQQNGELNIKYVQCQLEPFQRWEYRFPPLANVVLADDCFSAIDLAAKDAGTKAAWVDPPYYIPRSMGRMVACYPGHKPHDVDTMNLGINALRQTVELKPDHLLYSNYSSLEHDRQVEALMDGKSVDFGRLETMHQGNGEACVFTNEKVWVKSSILCEQLSLFAC